jgi:lantibiotic modifying enzyme
MHVRRHVMYDEGDAFSRGNRYAMAELTPDGLVGFAESIARTVLAGASRLDDGSLTWHRGYGLARQPVLDAGLFNGRMGEALFFAALFAATGRDIHREAALAASQALRRRAADPASRAEITGQVGIGMVGLGGMVYGLVRVSGFLDDPACLHAARNLAKAITPEAIARDGIHDVFWGAACAVLACLALEDAGVPEARARAVACAEHLLARRTADRESGLRGWATLTPGVPYAGFAHGTSGIAHALLRLYARTGDRRLYDAAMEGFGFERSLYREDLRDWPDCRIPEIRQPVISSWCHGAPGIALGRLSALSVVKEPDVESLVLDLDRALTRTAEPVPSGTDSLCCGTFGRADVLLQAADVLENPSLTRQAHRLAAMAAQRAEGRVWMVPAAEVSSAMAPGLWQGLAGIGYALLRLARPGAYPCLVALA